MAKKALVLGGGGAKGSYQMGVWQALREAQLDFDVIVGTSIGALNGAMMAQDDFETADELWNNIEYKNVFGEDQSRDIRYINSTLDMLRFAVNDKLLVGEIDAAPLESLVRKAIDETRIRNSKSDFGLVTVELPFLKPVTPMIDDIPEGKLYQYLMASSACFPVFSPYDIEGVKYIDGGYYDNVPISFAVDQGADEIIAVDLDGVGFVRTPKNADGVSITRISSHWDLGAVFDFDQSLFARNRRLGYYEALKAFGQKEGHYYTFQNGESLRNLKSMSDKAEKIIDHVAELLKRPVAQTLTIVERDKEIELLSKINRRSNPEELFCAIAEIAGVVYGIAPDRQYTFSEFNEQLRRSYFSVRKMMMQKKELLLSEDIRHIIASLLEIKNMRIISAELTRLINNVKYPEASKALSLILPKEYIAAAYMSILINCDE